MLYRGLRNYKKRFTFYHFSPFCEISNMRQRFLLV